MGFVSERIGRRLARYLQRPSHDYVAFCAIAPDRLRAVLRPGDVLLVEGDLRISSAIKYFTHSSWSHAAFFTGGAPGAELIEANLEQGVTTAPLAKYDRLNTRICRPLGLRDAELQAVLAHMRQAVGRSYDLRNVFDLARYFLPRLPFPHHVRRRLLALGSGDPTRAICSTLIAEAFQSVGYPILPDVSRDPDHPGAREILHIRHHSLYAPRDFDLSPYFAIVKPALTDSFDFHRIRIDRTPATGSTLHR